MQSEGDSGGTLELIEHRPWTPDLSHPEDLEQRLQAVGVRGDLLAADLASLEQAITGPTADLREAVKAAKSFRLDGLGADRTAIDRLLEERRRSLLRRIEHWLKGHEFVETAHRDETVEVPIFQLHCPSVAKCEVSYTETVETAGEAAWTIEVAGTGMGATNSFKLSRSATFTSKPGDCKLVFVPVKVRVSEISVFDRDKNLLGKGHQIESYRDQKSFRSPGLRSLGPGCCSGEAPPQSDEPDRFHLQDDTPGNVSEFNRSWEASSKLDVSIGLDAFDVKLKTSVSIANGRALKLTFKLAGGHLYLLWPCSDAYGIRWEVS